MTRARLIRGAPFCLAWRKKKSKLLFLVDETGGACYLLNMSDRLIETLTGWNEAEKALASAIKNWNATNETDSMRLSSRKRAEDHDGSGEYYELVCLNFNEAENSESEVWQLRTGW